MGAAHATYIEWRERLPGIGVTNAGSPQQRYQHMTERTEGEGADGNHHRLQRIFESVTGTDTVREFQDEQVNRSDLGGEDTAGSIETYLDDLVATDGLEDAIGPPGPD